MQSAVAPDATFLSSGGEMAVLIRDFPWHDSPLDAIRHWSPALRQFTGFVLSSPVPMALWWGPQLVQIHNDAYRNLFGDHALAVLGQPLDAGSGGARAAVAAVIATVKAGAPACSQPDLRLMLRREAGAEELFLSFTHIPVPDQDAPHAAAGVLTMVFNTASAAAPPPPPPIHAAGTGGAASAAGQDAYHDLAAAGTEAMYRINADGSEVNMLERRGVAAQAGGTSADIETWLRSYVIPEEQPAVLQALAEAARAQRTFMIEHRSRRRDGSLAWTQSRAVPLYDGQGQVREWVGTATDISWRQEMLDRQAVLVAELQHRTRNLLGVVRSIAAQTLESCVSLDDFQVRFEGRLGALSRVQALLTQGGERAITLGQLLHLELEALGAAPERDARVELTGPDVVLNHRSVQTLALAVHELATNARKHGALSTHAGRLAVTWNVVTAEGPRLVLDWRETGVTIPPGSASFGYGRELIERALPYTLNARTILHLAADGVHCHVNLPLQALPEGGTPHVA